MTIPAAGTAGPVTLSERLGTLWPGLMLTALVALLATLVNERVPLLSAMLVAIVAGLVLRNTGCIRPGVEAGLKFTGKTVLRAGVVLLGLRLSLPAVASLGWGAIVVIVLTVAAVFAVTLALGKAMKIPHATALLTATGTAICGAAAVAGMSAVVRPERDEKGKLRESVDDAAATAIASVTLFGTLAIVLLPVLVRALGLGDTAAGVWVGASVHEVGQVVATGGLISPEVLDVAVVAKLGRVATLAILVAVVGVLESRAERAAMEKGTLRAEVNAALTQPSGTAMASLPARKHTPIIPAFVIGFLVAVALRSVGEGHVPASVFDWANQVANFLLTMAMCAMGAGVNVRAFARSGGKALLLGAAACLVSAIVSLVGVLTLVH